MTHEEKVCRLHIHLGMNTNVGDDINEQMGDSMNESSAYSAVSHFQNHS